MAYLARARHRGRKPENFELRAGFGIVKLRGNWISQRESENGPNAGADDGVAPSKGFMRSVLVCPLLVERRAESKGKNESFGWRTVTRK